MDINKLPNQSKDNLNSSSSSSDSEHHKVREKNYDSSSVSDSYKQKRRKSTSRNKEDTETVLRKNFEKKSRSPKRDSDKNLLLKTKQKSQKREDSASPENKPRKNGLHQAKEKLSEYVNEKKKNKIFIPGLDGHLLSFVLFSELQHNNLKTEEIETAYKNYKSEYEDKRFRSFYVEHQNDEWFREKYEHDFNKKWKLEKNLQAKKIFDEFMKNMDSFEGLKLELRPQDESNKTLKIINYGVNKDSSGINDENILGINNSINTGSGNLHSLISSSPYFGFDPDKLTLFLHQIPKNVSRCDILDVLKKVRGFMSMSLSEPIKNQDFVRYCWVTFDTEENTESAYDSLSNVVIGKDFKLNPIKSKSTTNKKIRVTPPLFDERLQEDLELSKSIINLLDKEKNFEQSINFENKNKEFQLDLQLLYLRRVHGFCYYCIEEYDDERMLSTRCGNIHLRSYKRLGPRKQEVLMEINQDEFKNEIEWEKNLVKNLKYRIERGSNSFKKNEYVEELNLKRNEYCKLNTSEISLEKFICNLCSKMFKGANFVHNHIFNKHMTTINEQIDKPFYEALKYEMYSKDKNKIIDKYRIIHNMDEYLQYINLMKSLDESNYNNKNASRGNYDNRRSHNNSSNYSRKRYEKREFRDLDDPETINISNNGRSLISYDDL